MSTYKSSDFMELQRIWYKELELSGFKEIEDMDLNNPNYDNMYLRKSSFNQARNFKEATYTYYALCRNFLCHGDFASNFDQKVWEWYTEGLSVRNITKKVNQDPTLNCKISTFTTFSTLRQLKSNMLKYLESQEKSEDDQDLFTNSHLQSPNDINNLEVTPALTESEWSSLVGFDSIDALESQND